MTRAQLKTRITSNLGDSGSIYWTDTDKNYAIQDAYSDCIAMAKAVTKSATISLVANQPYYNLHTLISDFIGCIAIFNNSTNRWLFDDHTVRDFDKIRIDWEMWNGEPAFWAPVSPELVAIVPSKSASTGTLTVYYWAAAPTLSSDSDIFLLSDDLIDDTLEACTTGDLQEQAEEFTKASMYHERYEKSILEVAQRYNNMAKSDLILILGGQPL
jgi:hypothetical protein